jgi:mannose-6-phosphate isomerase-like protein (cupin superfamily)
MPVFRSGESVPAWCELRSFAIVGVGAGETVRQERSEPKEMLIAGRGSCRIRIGDEEHELAEGAIFDVMTDVNAWEITSGTTPATVIRMSGNWGEEVGGSGIFGAREVDDPKDVGNPVDYLKRTAFDSHFHDCDEYWILFEGRGTAVSEGKHFEVGPGDCVATGMGHHHDFPLVAEPVRAVFFETTLEGAKRRGHLWDHTHGKAVPKQDRI